MVGAVLTNDKGLAHTLFGAGTEEEEAPVEEAEEEEGEEKPVDGDPNDILKTSKYKYVPEVVEESKIHFWKVPRGGVPSRGR